MVKVLVNECGDADVPESQTVLSPASLVVEWPVKPVEFQRQMTVSLGAMLMTDGVNVSVLLVATETVKVAASAGRGEASNKNDEAAMTANFNSRKVFI